jgi:hypothetical protein
VALHPREDGREGSLASAPTLDPRPTSTPTPTAISPPLDTNVPLTGSLSRLHLTVSRSFLAKLAAARAARGHARPGATAEAILEEALDLLLAGAARGREAKVERPLRTPRPSHADHVPAEVRREVWARDQGRCQWPLDGGGICGSTHLLELDHSKPKARGGPPSVANLRVLCRPHNLESARRSFGVEWMSRFAGAGSRGAMRQAGLSPECAEPRPDL